MDKLWNCKLLWKEYICKFNILGPASGSKGGLGVACLGAPPYYAPVVYIFFSQSLPLSIYKKVLTVQYNGIFLQDFYAWNYTVKGKRFFWNNL